MDRQRASTILTFTGLALLLMFTTAGCTERVVQGNVVSYKYASYIGPLMVLAGISLAVIAWLVRKTMLTVTIAAVLLCPLFLVVIAPSMFKDRFVIGTDHYEANWGFWFAPSVQYVGFNELQQLRYISAIGPRDTVELEVHSILTTGEDIPLPTNKLVSAALPELFERLNARGYSVRDASKEAPQVPASEFMERPRSQRVLP